MKCQDISIGSLAYDMNPTPYSNITEQNPKTRYQRFCIKEKCMFRVPKHCCLGDRKSILPVYNTTLTTAKALLTTLE